MAFHIRRDHDLTTEIRRIAAEQVDEALADLTRLDDIVGSVHDCRKRCKKVRGLVRLVRPALGDQYDDANQAFRDAARALSDYRDSHALIGTFDRVVAVASAADELPASGVGPARAALADRRDRSTDAVDGTDDKITCAERLLRRGRDQISYWELDTPGWSAIAGGLHKTYARGADALAGVVDDPSPERYHELRKRAKYTWYHLRLLRDAAPSTLRPLARQFHHLTDTLGDAHDLAVLREQLRADPDEFGGDDVAGATVAMIDSYRRTLEQRGVGSASRLYAESPKRFTKRVGAYWDVWERTGEEAETGEIQEVFEMPETDAFDELNVSELRSLASSIDLPGRSTKLRDDLVAELRASGVSAP